MKKKIYLLLALCMFLFVFGISQIPQGKLSKPFIGRPGIKKTIAELRVTSANNTFKKKALDLTAIKPYRSIFKKYENLNRPAKGNSRGILLPPPGTNRLSSPSPLSSAPAVSAAGSTQQIWSNFLSIDFYENPTGWPPDPNGAAGSSQVIVASNNGLKVFDKRTVTDPPLVTPRGYSGVRAPGDLFITLEEFFSAVLPDTSSISDPHIRYDRLSKRWYVVAIEVNPLFENNDIYLAVSDGEKVTDASVFTFYAFNSSLFPYDPAAPFAPFLDFPTLGVDKNSVVIGGNQFGWDSLTNVGYAIDKKKLLRGQLVVYPFELGVANNITGQVSGMYTPQGVHNDDGSAKKSFFAGITYFQDGLVVASLQYDKNNQPWLASEITIPVEPFNNPRDNSHPGSMTPLQQNDTRLLAAAIHKNKITGKSSLWTAHAIGVDQSGHFINGSDSDFVRQGRTGSRWYEINNIYTKPALNQLGTVNDEVAKSGRRASQYFNPSIAASGQGHAILGGTTDAFNEYLNVFVAGRYNSDAKGTLQRPVKATNTTAIYAPYLNFGGFHIYIERWGDFSQTVVDPSDDQTIWTFQEYANVDDSYGVRVVELKAPPPATPVELGPLSNKMDTVVMLKGISVDNSGFFDPGKDDGGPGYNRLSVKSTGNIIASNIRFISPTKISFKLNTKNKPAGKYFLIITNPDGQIAVAEYNITAVAPGATLSQRSGSATANDAGDQLARKYIVTSDIYPNPTSGGFKLQVNAAKDFKGKILLITAGGKIISESSFNFSKGSRIVPLSLANAGSGDYLAAVYNEDNVLVAVHKIVKQ